MKKLFEKYKQAILYLIFGGLTTFVNIGTYYILSKISVHDFFVSSTIINNSIAWLVSVLFAYVTNKIFVFESKSLNPYFVIREMTAFIGCRILSGLIDTGIMHIMVDILKFNDMIVKIFSNIIVIILNYLFSKLIVFKAKTSDKPSVS